MGIHKKAVPIYRDGKGKVEIILSTMQKNQVFSFAIFHSQFESFNLVPSLINIYSLVSICIRLERSSYRYT